MSSSGPAPLQRPAASRLVGSAPPRRPVPKPRALARRRRTLSLTKWSLPVFAAVLLGLIAAWPQIEQIRDKARISFHRAFQVDPESGQMTGPRYHGIDERGRPYTVTAATAQQEASGRVLLSDPKGDIITENGSWIMVEGKQGVFIQHQSLMDVSDDVRLYREDGIMLFTDTVAMDLKAGAASSADNTHVEGPFGTLDASKGFTLLDKGGIIQFLGPSHLVLNGGEKK